MKIISLGDAHITFEGYEFKNMIDGKCKLSITNNHKNFTKLFNKKIVHSRRTSKKVKMNLSAYFDDNILSRFDKKERIIGTLVIDNFEKSKKIIITNMMCTVKTVSHQDGFNGKSTINLEFISIDLEPQINYQ